jgi:ERCC4-type nuclease
MPPMLDLDQRTGSRELLPILRQAHPTLPVRLCHLEYGDASIVGNGPEGAVMVGVERKTLGDLLHSIDTGRLMGHQVPGMVNSFGVRYLVIEGSWRRNPDTGVLEVRRGRGGWGSPNGRAWMWREMQGYLNTLEQMCGFHVHQTAGPWETADLLAALHGWWGKEWGEHKAHQVLGAASPVLQASFSSPSVVRRVAAQLPGVGWTRSAAVEKKFASVVEMVGAGEKEWMEVEGVGKVTARKVVEALRGRRL